MSNIERCRLGYDQPSGEYIVDLLEGRLDQLERAQQELLRRLDDRPCCQSPARERALAVASQDPPSGVTPDEAVAEERDVLASIGDTCPECPPDCGRLRAA